MPLYSVDLDDDRTKMRDDVGTDMPDPEMARSVVMRMLAETAKSRAAHGSDLLLVATIRDGTDQELYQIKLALTCFRPGQVPSESVA